MNKRGKAFGGLGLWDTGRGSLKALGTVLILGGLDELRRRGRHTQVKASQAQVQVE